MEDAFELVEVGPLWDVALCCKAGCEDEVLCFGCAAICCFDVPAAFFCVEVCSDDDAVECCLVFDAEDFVAVIEVGSEVFVGWVVVGPVVSSYR